MDTFQTLTIQRFGEKGKKWLQQLPQLVHGYEEKWEIIVGKEFPLYYNYVVAAKTKNGKDVVLKVAYPDSTEFAQEIAALETFGTPIAVKVLEKDLEKGGALLERILPGENLSTLLDNKKEVHVAAELGKKLWKNTGVLENFATVESWFTHAFSLYENRFPRLDGPIPRAFYMYAKNLSESLLNKSQNVLLHGDFHHMNILSSGDTWKIIDPKGVIGDPLYDIAVYLHNPTMEFIESPQAKQIVQERIAIFSDVLKLSRENIIQWGIAQSFLSILWRVEEKGTISLRAGLLFSKLLKSLL